MKVVLLHDWLVGFRGGERVLEAFCEMFPDAPIYTLIHSPGSTSSTIEKHNIYSSFLNKIPNISKHYRKFLPLFPKAAESLKIEEADLVISSSHCVIKGVKKPVGSRHLSYIHSPMRYIYDQFEVYFGKDAPLYQRVGAHAFRNYLTNWDIKSNQNVDMAVANSNFVSERIKEYYQLEPRVVHPFVDLADFEGNETVEKGDYYIMVTAFAPNKRVDLAIKSFNKLGLPLKIVGSGQQEKNLKNLAGPNIEFLGNLKRVEVVELFKKAKALIFPGVEDFGITPLESLASGTPVIAFKSGGVLETLNNDVAVFFEESTEESLIAAVNKFDKMTFDSDLLKQRARDFSKESFKKNMQKLIDEVMK